VSQLTVEQVRQFIREAWMSGEGEWVVRGGSEVLFKFEGEPARAWRYTTLPQVTYFSDAELVKKPSGPTRDQVWVFKRDGKLFAIAERQLYHRPTK
jgi:hypothetical protein